MAWDEGLTGPALDIAKTDAKRLRVMAGPGTGKSYALKHRVMRLIEQGQDPSRIWAVTFTRNAADSLSKDLEGIGAAGSKRICIGTLHSYCFGLLDSKAAYTGRTPRIVMAISASKLLQFENSMLVGDLVNEKPEFGEDWVCLNRMKYLEAGWAGLESDTPDNMVNQLLEQRLNAWLNFHKAMVMSELVPEALRLLRSGQASDALTAFDHVIVDEYQDLNKAEQEIINLMSENGSLAIVGDANQSIYSFRHAHPKGIEDFQDRHHNTHDVSLVECRRNPTRIVAMANGLIAHNPPHNTQSSLQPRPDNPDGEVHIVRWNTVDEEAEGTAKYVKHLLSNNPTYKPEDILIIVPRKILGRKIHDAVSNQNIPVYNFEQEALEEDTAQRAFALLTLLNDSEDRVMLRWWLGHNDSGHLNAPYQKLREYCEANSKSPRAVLEDMMHGKIDLPGMSPLMASFRSLVEETARLSELSLRDLVNNLLPEGNDNCTVLRDSAERALANSKDIEQMYASMVNDIIQPKNPNGNSVRVMTMHKAKGLTSKVVIVAGCCDGLVPFKNNKLADDERNAAMREQRRLFYVAITRCKEVLVISHFATINPSEYSDMRIPFSGVDQSNRRLRTRPSPFINELGPTITPTIDGAAWQATEYMEQSRNDQI